MNFMSLDDLCPALDKRAETGYCLTMKERDEQNARGRFPKLIKNYVNWEHEVALPAITAAGYKPLNPFFSDAEGASVRSRRVTCEDPRGVYVCIHYGD